jgi:PhzF family phenazine biosynthesis protein
MSLPLFIVDAFTEKPFAGNPAAVCLLDAERPDAWLQAVAAEMNLSETAFLLPRGEGFHLRWFTPQVEVSLCGHATLASAHVLWKRAVVDPALPISFQTQSGTLTATRSDGRIELDFPLLRPEWTGVPNAVVTALGVTPTYAGKSRLDYLIVVESESIVREMEPDFAALAIHAPRGVIVTSRSASPDYDFVSRFFAPAAGIDEDPVTGSAHCCLAAYWSEELGKSKLVGYQASRRGGVVHVRVAGERAILGGNAVTVVRGKLAEGVGRLG